MYNFDKAEFLGHKPKRAIKKKKTCFFFTCSSPIFCLLHQKSCMHGWLLLGRVTAHKCNRPIDLIQSTLATAAASLLLTHSRHVSSRSTRQVCVEACKVALWREREREKSRVLVVVLFLFFESPLTHALRVLPEEPKCEKRTHPSNNSAASESVRESRSSNVVQFYNSQTVSAAIRATQKNCTYTHTHAVVCMQKNKK